MDISYFIFIDIPRLCRTFYIKKLQTDCLLAKHTSMNQLWDDSKEIFRISGLDLR